MYKYYSAMRPIVPGGYPKTEPIHKIVNFDEKKLIPSINERVWGYVEYERALSAEDAAKYDLLPEPPYEDKAKICRLLCKVIQQTDGGANLVALEYDAEHDLSWPISRTATNPSMLQAIPESLCSGTS